MSEAPTSFYATRAKRFFDFVGGLVLLILTLPVRILCAAAIAADDGRPVHFHQERVGKDGQIFELHKFRTMTVGTHAASGGYPTPAMVTKVGNILRRLSLDEIPQLTNILRGEMSFVGPRPTLASQVARYTPEQHGRHLVRPGLTGLAQIRHRNNAPWSKRIITDLEYVDGVSLKMDLWILLQTIPAALKGDGQVSGGQTAVEVDDLGDGPGIDEARSSPARD